MDRYSAVLTISAAAELAEMHPQTLRQYDRLGLVSPQRTAGRGRRYSLRDVAVLREIQRLSQEEGINLAGIKRILRLEARVEEQEREIEMLRAQLEPGSRVFRAGPEGEVVSTKPSRRRVPETVRDTRRRRQESGAVVIWRSRRQ